MVGAFEQMRRFGLIAVIVLAVLVALVAPPSAYAEGSGALADNDVITVEAQVRGVNSEGWRVFVSYARPEAGKPTDFTITVEDGPNGTGPYRYQQGFISKEGAYVYDPSFGTFDPPQDSNVLSYEFIGAGRYEYQFLVQPTGKLNKRFSISVDVEGGGLRRRGREGPRNHCRVSAERESGRL